MTEARGYERKAHLTPEEKVKVAYFYLVRGVAQQVLSDLFDVNPGRVATAINEVRAAVGWNGFGVAVGPKHLGGDNGSASGNELER